MNISMAGIDFETATINQRQAFSFGKDEIPQIYARILQNKSVLGAALLITCNRTEIYLSCLDGCKIDAFELLCDCCNLDYESNKSLCRSRHGAACFRYLSQLGCGALSQIWGEDQIITQVKNAITVARENNASDSILEVFFRNAITAAKKIKTEIKFTRAQQSVAVQALEALQAGVPTPKNILVIGNGEVGRMVANALLQSNFCVTMTRRTYKHTEVQIPDGAEIIDYAERYAHMASFDAIISATSSPHCTVELAEFEKLAPKPKILIDLAVPRDIDIKIAEIKGIKLYDVDSLCADQIQENHDEQIKQADVIIEKYHSDFLKWHNYKVSTVAD